MTKKLLLIRGTKTVDELHWKLGRVLWDHVGMGRTEAGLKKAVVEIRKIKTEFWNELRVTGEGQAFNQELEKAGRLADYFELGELMALDGLQRDESCGGHFREEHQTPDGEAIRNDDKFAFVAAWFYQGEGKEPEMVKEELKFENVKLATRSYK